MKLTIETKVDENYLNVKDGFTESLFSKLSPPFPPVKLLRFDGTAKGDLVTLELNFLLFKQKWASRIIEDKTDEKEFYFIDKGVELPFFLRTWSHKHRINRIGNAAIIRDEIEYSAPFGLLSLLLYPAMLLQFAYRIPIYKKVFKRSDKT